MKKIGFGFLFGWLLCLGISNPVLAKDEVSKEETIQEVSKDPVTETELSEPVTPDVQSQEPENESVMDPAETIVSNQNVEKEIVADVQPEPVKEEPNVLYQSHVQTYGWQSVKKDGQLSGTTGQSKRLEAVKIHLNNKDYAGSVEYRTHIQGIGWQDWKKDGQLSGTTGQAKRLEAICIRLSGEIQNTYDVWYRVQIQTYGWLGWTKNGEMAGSEGLSKRMEGIEIRLLKKTDPSLNASVSSCYSNQLQYNSHVQSIGWQGYVKGGQTSGTQGRSKRLEAIRIQLRNTGYKGSIYYQTHIQGIGWQDWKKDGEISGTTGQSRRVEAIRVRLEGDIANHYSVSYRSYCQGFGWFEWTSDGNISGTTGNGLRLESLEIMLVQKNSAMNTSNTVTYMNKQTGYANQTIVQGVQRINNRPYFFKENGELINIPYIGTYNRKNDKFYKNWADQITSILLKSFGNNLRNIYNWTLSLQYQWIVSDGSITSDWYADYIFKNGKGNCYSMAAVVYKAAKKLGYDVHQMSGYHRVSKGLSPHSWLEVVENGKTYLIDPDFEKELRHNGWYIQYGTKNTLKYVNYKRMN